MADIAKPSGLNIIWSSAGDILKPSDSKIAQGWSAEIPPRQWFNYIDNKQDQGLAHINQHGIPIWDAVTEYQAVTSFTQGSNGKLYKCVQTNTNQNPVNDTNGTYWTEAIPAAVDTYTKTEIDNRTTKATTGQAQAYSDNNSLITPLLLGQSFQGVSNRSLGTNGFQRFGGPNGLILQWGEGSTASNGTGTISFPIPFPSTCLQVIASPTNTGNTSPQTYVITTGTLSRTGLPIYSTGASAGNTPVAGTVGYRYLAIGF